MCTVTFVPQTVGYFLTSNRDEKSTRSKALLPKIYTTNNESLMYPKDEDAGGTWIVLKKNNDALCLLNGAFETFVDTGNYKKSRGIIVKEIAAQKELITSFENINLTDTAPFTLIIIYNKALYECRWDGSNKFIKLFDNSIAHIWSSATLYSKAQQEKRIQWFENWQSKHINPLQNDLIDFHKNTGEENVEENLIMNRNNDYFTVSVTSIDVNEKTCSMKYDDIINKVIKTTSFTDECTATN